MKIHLIFFLFILFVGNLSGQKHFEFTPEMKEAHALVMSLRFVEAKPLIAKIKKDDPENLMVYHVENYMDFFTCYINENKAEFEQLEQNKDSRLRMILKGDKNSPYYLYLQANIRLHWALARLKFEEYFTAFLEVNKAFKLLNENTRKFPDFVPNKKDLGILHAAIGTIPDNYRWGVQMLTSLSGTINQGREEIQSVMDYAKENDFIYAQEPRVLYAYLLMHLQNDGAAAWNMLSSDDIDPTTNPLAAFTVSNVAMRTGRNDEAITTLENRPLGAKYHPFPYLGYMLGEAKLRRLDVDADQYFLDYLKNFKGRHFIKEAYQKLAWHSMIHGDMQKFYTYFEKIKSNGRTVTGGDKNADQDARNGVVYNVALLKARLLFDGGYYEKAQAFLSTKSSENFKNQRDKLEFTYRMGRVLHKLKRRASAIQFYEKTIETGADEPYYFACNSALQLGLLFEDLGNKTLAKTYFKKCTSIYPKEHKTALHQQAKAGLARVK